MLTPNLREFAEPVPVCKLTSTLANALEVFRSCQCDLIVVVSEQECPLGVLSLRQVATNLLSQARLGLEASTLLMATQECHKPLSELKPPPIETLKILPDHLSVSQFLSLLLESPEFSNEFIGAASPKSDSYLQQPFSSLPEDKQGESILPSPLPTTSCQHWALVDEEGKFLGLLNSWWLLKFLAPNFRGNYLSTPVTTKTKPADLNSLVQLLEQLPLPLSLQTATGQVVSQNFTWRQLMGKSSESQGDNFTVNVSMDVDAAETIATPPSQAVASNQDWATQLSLDESQQRLFSLVKVPFQPSVAMIRDWRLASGKKNTPQQENSEEGIKHNYPYSPPLGASTPSASAASIPNSQSVLSNLWLVLAQDTTEQQLFAQELVGKNANLEQLNRLKDEFLACISHELKTPLTSILGLSSLLKEQSLGKLNERQARYARLIYQNGRQLMTVVNDILDLTRLETEQLELDPEPVQIQVVCSRAYSQARQRQHSQDQYSEKLAETTLFTLEIEPGLETLIADERRLCQMLVHLLDNALKFTDEGGEIGLRVNRWEGWIAFRVWDTGIGIPLSKQHLLFEKFQQLEEPLARRFEGAGLGLVLTQRLARLHGGDISFTSKINQGSEFTILLPPCPPLRSNRAGKDLNAESFNPISGKSLTPLQSSTRDKCNRLVLIIETVPQYLEILSEQLEHLGYRAVIARSGMEALNKARTFRPYAILLNPFLPQISGWEVLNLLKSDAQTKAIPVLVMATLSERQQAGNHQVDSFLSLPVQEQELRQSLDSLHKQQENTSCSLTILHLSPLEIPPSSYVLSSELSALLSFEHSELNYRLLEADDLEQAELLVRVWHPDVVLLDGSPIADPLLYLKQLSQYTGLTSLPLVTLDHQTTEAANQVGGLSVYPCLAQDKQQKTSALLQVIQIAAGVSCQRSILVMDIPGPGTQLLIRQDQAPAEATEHDNSKLSELALYPYEMESSQQLQVSRKTILPWQHKTEDLLKSFQDSKPTYPTPAEFSASVTKKAKLTKNADASSSLSLRTTPTASVWHYGKQLSHLQASTPWIQALVQYLQTAGFRSLISCSWLEVYRQLQAQRVDLLLIRLTDTLDHNTLLKGLVALEQLPKLPPILILDQRLNATYLDQAITEREDLHAQLDSRLKAIATEILCGSSQSMTKLLEKIHQILS
ncbi:MAG: response regulator [Symploca sp. SIO2E9]|nr:response regulator [Symploca sp. SIO2E9]